MSISARVEQLLLAAELGSGDPNRRSVRDWVVDVVMFGYAVVAAVSITVNDHGQVGTAVLVLDGVLAVPACLALWVRRSRPLQVAWLTVGLSAISSAALHAGLLAIFSAAIHGRPRRAVEVTAAAIVATAVNCAIYPDPGGSQHGYNWNFLAFWAATTIAALALGSFIRVRREQVQSLQERARRLQSEQELRVREAQLAERARIAREMHDVLAHRISLLSVHAGALEFNPDARPDEIARAAGVIRSSARAAQEELREVIGVLRAEPARDSVQPPQPTLADLEALIEESRHAGMDVTLVDALGEGRLPASVGRTAYRVVQEALTNARKHAASQPVSITIAGRPGGDVEIEVVNRPAGGQVAEPPEQLGSGTGLVGLAERLALAGGRLEHRALGDGGFLLAASVPWATARDES